MKCKNCSDFTCTYSVPLLFLPYNKLIDHDITRTLMSKQFLLFPNEESSTEKKYSSKIAAPVYQPKHDKPHVMTLCDTTKTTQLLQRIEEAQIKDEEKSFLRAAAWRHAVFHYERIADYYSHANKEMQELMEQSALVIIDFDDAIANGFVTLCEDIRQQYLEEYNDAKKPS